MNKNHHRPNVNRLSWACKVIVISHFLFLIPHLSFAQLLSDKYNEERPVVVVCDWDKPPYEFLNDQGEPAGSNIDILRAVMKELGLPVKFVMKEWTIALKTFERGEADIILANVNRYRHDPFVVSENIVIYNRIRVATTSDSLGLVTMRQLEREGVVFKPGDYSAFYFDSDTLSSDFMEFQTPKVALMGLINGDYKYYVWGEEPLKWKIKELNLTGINLQEVGIPISEIHFVGRDRQLVEQIDDHYSRLKQSGEVAILQDKWLHPAKYDQEKPSVAIAIVLFTILIVAILWFFFRLARRHVISATRRARELNEMMSLALHMGNFSVMEYDIRSNRVVNKYGTVLPRGGLTLEEFTHRIHPDQQQEFTQKMQLLMSGRERSFELNKRWNSGTDENPHWLNFQGHAICEVDDEGRPAYVVNAIHDVTQEIEEDQAARILVHKYECLSNMPFVAISFYDHDGWLIDLNDSMRELCGMNDGKPDAQRYWETVCMFDIPLFRDVLKPEDRDDVLFCQHMNYKQYGIDRYIECHVNPLFNADAEITNYFVTTFDITDDRKRDHVKHLQDKIIRATKKDIDSYKRELMYVLEKSDRFLWRSDIAAQKIYFYRQLGEPEVCMDFDTYLGYMVEEDRLRTRRAMNNFKLLDKELHDDIYHFNHTIISPNEGWFDISGTPIHDEEGNVLGHQGISIDITPLMIAKRQLEEETRRAADSMRMKSAFMASMTHELRTPLNAIVGFTGVLEALGDSPDRAEYVRIIRNSSDMLQRLINDIIEASSITDGHFTIQPEEVDFADAFEDICLTLQQRVEAANLEFHKDNPLRTFHTRLDIGRIQQVLTNFVTNAVKFTKQGHIHVGYQQKNGGIYLYCEDTGIGIPLEKQKMVFDRFVKLDEFVQGTGMGLAICKSIVEQCGGEIGVVSDGEGKGSTFWAWIPVK